MQEHAEKRFEHVNKNLEISKVLKRQNELKKIWYCPMEIIHVEYAL